MEVGEYEVAIDHSHLDATIANGDVWVLGRAESTDGSPESLRNNIDQVDQIFLIMEMMPINYSSWNI